jgi:hypothetical protein
LEEGRIESYCDTQGIVMRFVKEALKPKLLDRNINYVARLRRRKGTQATLVKFTSFSVTLEVLKKTRTCGAHRVE